MKKVASFCKIFSCCIFLLYWFSSCKTTMTGNDYHAFSCGDPMHKRTRNIRIQNDETNPAKIKLIDEEGCPADSLNVLQGQTVEWQIDDGALIQSIDSISAKDKAGNGNVYDVNPHKKFLSKNWKGKIKRPYSPDKEYYKIVWRDMHHTENTYDPLIQLNPDFTNGLGK